MPRPRNRARGALDRQVGKTLAEQVVTLEQQLTAETDLKDKTELELRLARVAARLLDQCSPESRVSLNTQRTISELGGGNPRPVMSDQTAAEITWITALAPTWLVWREFQALRLGQDHSEPVTEQGRD